MEILSKVWNSQPLHTTIRELLEKKKGAITDSDLLKALKVIHKDVNFATLNKTLMKLELNGIIHVFELTKTKRRVELVKKK